MLMRRLNQLNLLKKHQKNRNKKNKYNIMSEEKKKEGLNIELGEEIA